MSNPTKLDIEATDCNNKSGFSAKVVQGGRFRIVFAVLTIVLIVLCIVFLALFIDRNNELDSMKQNSKQTSTESTEKDYKIYNPDKVEIAAGLISSMDPSVNPCDDFFQYACGGWIKKTALPEGYLQYNSLLKLHDENQVVLNDILKKIKGNSSMPTLLQGASTFYESCMNVSGIEDVGDAPLKDLVQKLGSWPLTDPQFNRSSWNFLDVLVNFQKTLNSGFIFEAGISADLMNSSKNVITFAQTGVSRQLYSDLTLQQETKKSKDLHFMNKIALEMGANRSMLGYLETVSNFQEKIDKIALPAIVFQSKIKENYESMSLKEFSNKTDIPLDWLLEFLNKLFDESGHTVKETEQIVSYSTPYIKQAYKLFLNLTPEVQSSYVIWNSILKVRPYLSQKYEDIYYDYQTMLLGSNVEAPARWTTCVTSTLTIYNSILSNPFVQTVFDSSARTAALEMVRGIKKVFQKNLDSMDWMDDSTRNYAKDKASKITESIGYPDYILDNVEMQKYYSSYVVKHGQYFSNGVEIFKFQSKTNRAQLGKPVDKTIWKIPPVMVNAIYDPQSNGIVFPAGILQSPFYDKRAPRAVNYGAIGMVVAHEISHGFDNSGKQFDIYGNYNDWWSKSSSEQFSKKSQCFTKQYSAYNFLGNPVNGSLTLGENLADNGAIRQSYQAYKNWVAANGEEEKLPGLDLTPDQLYFLAFGQTWCAKSTPVGAYYQILTDNHSPNEFRVKGCIQNSEEFSKVFNCPAGSPMNPASKCRLW